MDLDDITDDELLDLLLDFNVTEEWQLLSIRDHWKQQYKNICSLFATDKVELNKRLLRLNKAYNVFTSIEQDQRRLLYLRFLSLLHSDHIDLLEQINDSDQFSRDPDFLKNSRNREYIADLIQRQYEITKERRRRDLEEAAAWKADREIDPARRRSQEEVEQSNSNAQTYALRTAPTIESYKANHNLKLLNYLPQILLLLLYSFFVIVRIDNQQQNPPQQQSSSQQQRRSQQQDTPQKPDYPAEDTWIWPTTGIFSSGYGWRNGQMHYGIDITNKPGTPIRAARSGMVVFAGWNQGGLGYLVVILHSDKSLSRYGHNELILVKSFTNVTKGEIIALMGSTGSTERSQLHFEIIPYGDTAKNPLLYLPRPELK